MIETAIPSTDKPKYVGGNAMNTIILLGIFWSIYGVLGLFGIQKIPSEYKGKNWTKRFIRSRGVSWILLGFPWIIFYLIVRNMNINNFITAMIIIVISIPSIIYSVVSDRKYKTLLKNNQS